MTTSEVGTPHRLGAVDQIPLGEGRAFAVGAQQVAVFRLRDGTLRATQAHCPHAGGPLADGQLDPSTIVCPLHMRAFSFADGRCAEGEVVALHEACAHDGEIVIVICDDVV
ncbi:MAG: Rieske (2Fe-2S) protein [Actinomycetota bacterium]|nr:Rieske (2Fe-2S) protein [Actinomycetota bacterium]